tara:strand:- start:356 stop:793 length:438 start_codon:yes stop_codon:yes gene_type:complete
MRLLLINGPNLNLLGMREPDLYGSSSLEKIELHLKEQAQLEGVSLECFQSNFEGALIDRIQSAIGEVDGILINAGAYTHTSVAIRDALLAGKFPYVEVHLTNVFSREDFRHKSFLSDRSIGVVSGFGLLSYEFAFKGLLNYLKKT